MEKSGKVFFHQCLHRGETDVKLRSVSQTTETPTHKSRPKFCTFGLLKSHLFSSLSLLPFLSISNSGTLSTHLDILVVLSNKLDTKAFQVEIIDLR